VNALLVRLDEPRVQRVGLDQEHEQHEAEARSP
jgi:hypothetical protein